MTTQNTSKSDLQRHLVCEGTRTRTAGWQIRWSNRWLAIGRGYDEDGDIAEFVNIPMPANGTVIPKSIGGAGVTVQAAPNGILLGAWETLYYDPAPSGDVNAGSFVIVPYTDQFIAPDSWVWIAKRVGSQHIEWADRQRDNGDAVDADFWRRATNADSTSDAMLPSQAGGVDYQGNIHHQGKLGVGALQRFGVGGADQSWRNPVALLDVGQWNALRTGPDRRNVNDGIYATAAINQGPDARATAAGVDNLLSGAAAKFAFLHQNQSAGLVFGWNGIITQVGGSSHDVGLAVAGTSGEMAFQFPKLPVTGWANTWHSRGTTPNANVGWQRIFSINGAAQFANEQVRRSSVGNGNGAEWRWHGRNHAGSQVQRMRSLPAAGSNAGRLDLNPNLAADDKILVLYGNADNAGQSYSLGIRNSTLGYFVSGPGAFHRFYASNTDPLNGSIMMLWERNNGESGVRFEKGLPAGNTRPANVAVNDLWLDTSGPGDPIVRCRIV